MILTEQVFTFIDIVIAVMVGYAMRLVIESTKDGKDVIDG